MNNDQKKQLRALAADLMRLRKRVEQADEDHRFAEEMKEDLSNAAVDLRRTVYKLYDLVKVVTA